MTDPNSSTAPSSGDTSGAHHSDGPSPHEDLTIGEILQTVHADAGARHPGKNGYHREKGKVEWIDQEAAEEFISKHGGEHPSNYEANYGNDWQIDFFQSDGTPHIPIMNTDTNKTPGSIADQTAEAVKRKSKDACSAIEAEASHLLACASDSIRKNPIPSVAGAFAFGLALAYLIMPRRPQETFEDRYLYGPLNNATDAVSGVINSLRGNLKFW